MGDELCRDGGRRGEGGAAGRQTGGAPDAVFTFSDYMAIGVIQALRGKGLRVPEDVSVMGFDGIEVGGFLDPSLSTVEISKHQLGVAGAKMLLDLIEGGGAQDGSSTNELVLPPKIIIRASTAPRSGAGARS